MRRHADRLRLKGGGRVTRCLAARVFSLALLGGALAASALGADSPALPVVIPPGHPFIRYVGRFEKKDPQRFRFAWAGSSFVFRFEGKAANLLMEDECSGGPNKLGGNTNNYFTIVVDQQAPLELSLEKGRTVYRVGEGLEDGVHTVTVFRRNCPRINPVKFLGLQLEEGKSLREPPPKKPRFLEVIGDSISVGYGIMGKDKTSPSIPENENCYLTYGAVAARELDADFTSIAWSGFGVYRDLNNKPENVLANLYDLTVPHDKERRWAFEEYTPDAVVINLGTNDFNKGDPPKAEFNAAYRGLVEKVWSHAPKAHIFCAAGGMITDAQVATLKAYLGELCADLAKEGKPNIHFVAFPSQNTIPGGVAGQWHPSIKAHRVMADILVQALKKELGW